MRPALLLFIGLGLADARARADLNIPAVAGIEIRAGKTVAIPGAASAIMYRFEDGRIVVMGKTGWNLVDGRRRIVDGRSARPGRQNRHQPRWQRDLEHPPDVRQRSGRTIHAFSTAIARQLENRRE